MSGPLCTEHRSRSQSPAQAKGLGIAARMLLVLSAVVLAAALATARWLIPDARGFGTHEQLRLPPCAFRVMSGIPCPACGMTTSFAHLVRGQVVRAFRVNAAGCLLGVAAVALIPWCLISAAVGRPIAPNSPAPTALVGLMAIWAVCVAVWSVRMLFLKEQG